MPTPVINPNLDLEPLNNEEILKIARKQGEDPDRICSIIDEFRNIIYEREDCTPHRTDTEFLIKFLRARFWRIESSYKLLCNYCNFRNANRDLYEKLHPLDLKDIGEADVVTVTPYKDQLGRRIMIYRFGNWIPSKVPVDDILKTTLLLLEMGALEPSFQVLGGVGIIDLTNLSLRQVFHLTPSVAQKMLALIVTSLPIRTNAIHIVFQNWVFNTAFSIFKPFLSSRMRERIYIHGDDMSSLHKHILPENLPKRYGGIHDDCPYTIWVENLLKNEKILRELESLGYVVHSRNLLLNKN
ncbi:clavesin-2-like [Condylostylus longicornis]|uniref:clavesin-2-like n=1 Tax=Condylostylus longicornis TaxID=2530218 RepID=UPI00244E4E7F|nr:clavesin-2-like [Condylostylus longicornis]XP_055389372.1 clavesin-2-like [Condylostylus longicornis]XP_055389373.1 clavesin-2-like [Condylostylus longicornis]XP_055389374.1 clavesin-2-like [Condylostylus longicornis]